MAEINAFKGLRYTSSDLNSLVCPPYDIISDAQRENFLNENPHNIIRLELPKGDDCYKNAGSILKTWLSEGVLKQDDKDSIYVYEMEFSVNGQKNSVKGFVSLVKLEEFSKGVVLPHEETLSKAKTDRFNLMSETFCNFSQIYSLYMDEDKKSYTLIDSCSKKAPDMEITDGDGTVHRIWIISDEEVLSNLKNIFADKKLYIADGHHRYETALNFHKHLCETGVSNENSLSGYIEMMLVNMENSGLVVFPTHRIVRDLSNFNENEIIEQCKEYFNITTENDISNMEKKLDSYYASGDKAVAMFTGGDNYTLMVLKDKNIIKKFLPEMSDAYCQLDVTLLHSLILERILGIDKENMANQINLTYTRSYEEAIASVKSENINCAFILNPTRVEEIRDVALANEKMPQKSTYFYPKLITGLVMNKFI